VAQSAYDDSTDFVDVSARETELLKQNVFVGVSRTSFAEALDNAWEVAKRAGIPSGTRFKVLEQTAAGYNPFTDFKVTIATWP